MKTYAWRIGAAGRLSCLLRGLLSLVFSKSFLQFLGRLNLWFLGDRRRLTWLTGTTSRVASHCTMLGFGGVVVLRHALIVRLQHVFWYSLHREDLQISARAVWQRIFDLI